MTDRVFPYQQTFDAIVAAVSLWPDRHDASGISISVRKFQEAFNSHRDAGTFDQGIARSEVQSREAIARIIAPATWDQYDKRVAFLGKAPMEPDVRERGIEHEKGFCQSSLDKADAILALGAAQGSAHPSVRECLKEWIEQGYIDADGEHCGSAAYAPAVYKRSVAALAAEEEPRGLGEEAIREAAESTAVGAQIVRREGDLLVCYSGFNLSRFVRYLALSVPSAHRGGEA